MNDLITVKPKEKRKGFLTENLVLNKTPIDHEIVFNKIKEIKLSEDNGIIDKYILAYDEYFKKNVKNSILPNEIDRLESENLEGSKLKRYLEYRYKYKIFPEKKIIEDVKIIIQFEKAPVMLETLLEIRDKISLLL